MNLMSVLFLTGSNEFNFTFFSSSSPDVGGSDLLSLSDFCGSNLLSLSENAELLALIF